MADTPYSPRIIELAEKWVRGTISDQEKRQFVEWYNQFDDSVLTLPAELQPVVRQMQAEGLQQLRERIAVETAREARLSRFGGETAGQVGVDGVKPATMGGLDAETGAAGVGQRAGVDVAGATRTGSVVGDRVVHDGQVSVDVAGATGKGSMVGDRVVHDGQVGVDVAGATGTGLMVGDGLVHGGQVSVDVAQGLKSGEIDGQEHKRDNVAVEGPRIGKRPGLLVLISQRRDRQIAAAAVLIGVIGIGAWLVRSLSRRPSTFTIAAKQVPMPAPTQDDVLPGSNKAMLTLGNGSTIALDSAHDGSLAHEGSTRVVKTADGQLKYLTDAGAGGSAVSGGVNAAETVTTNLLQTPRGGQYKLVLPDGSKVWLNAASSIRYPTAFVGSERTVTVTGEAYFEIAKNPGKPFRVFVDRASSSTHNPMEIAVLGTSFDVHAYDADGPIKTTLLEGSVKLVKGNSSGILRPGMQGQFGPNDNFESIEHADVEKAVAWKNGLFDFKDEKLETILREVSRWYDVTVEYKGGSHEELFTGQLSRNITLAGVIKILQLSDVSMTIEGKTLIVH